MQDIFELTPELLMEQSQEMLRLRSDYENLFANISSDLRGMNNSWSDLLSNNFSAKISSTQRAFSGALAMLQNSATSARLVAEAARELDTTWASKISGLGDHISGTQNFLDLIGEDVTKGSDYISDRKDLLEVMLKLKEKYGDEVPPSIQAWIKQLGKDGDKLFFDKTFSKVDGVIKVLEKLAEEDYSGAFKSGGKEILKAVFGEAVKGTAGKAVELFGYEYDPAVKYYINLGLGIGEGIGEFVQEPSWENVTEIAWNISVKPVLETAGSSIETLSRLIPGISEYYYDEHGAEDIGDAAAIALGDFYDLFSADEGMKEYGANYYKDGMWEGLWGGFEDIASFVKDYGGPVEAAKSFFSTAYADSQENLSHMAENAGYFWEGLKTLVTGVKEEPLSKIIRNSGSGGGGGQSF